MKELLENGAFCNGVAVGINLYQQKVIMAHERREPLSIDGEKYYIQNDRELLQRMLDEICR